MASLKSVFPCNRGISGMSICGRMGAPTGNHVYAFTVRLGIFPELHYVEQASSTGPEDARWLADEMSCYDGDVQH